jgi:hypothetical protein
MLLWKPTAAAQQLILGGYVSGNKKKDIPVHWFHEWIAHNQRCQPHEIMSWFEFLEKKEQQGKK